MHNKNIQQDISKMPREYYRNFFISVKPFIKLNYFLKKRNIPRSDMSAFLNQGANSVSNEKLSLLYQDVLTEVKKHFV